MANASMNCNKEFIKHGVFYFADAQMTGTAGDWVQVAKMLQNKGRTYVISTHPIPQHQHSSPALSARLPLCSLLAAPCA